MTRALAAMAAPPRWSNWFGYLVMGVTLGLLAVAGQRAGFWMGWLGLLRDGVRSLNDAVGPVWIPMLILCCRVLVVSVRAAATRSAGSKPRGSGSRELEHLAPLFTGLGFTGTVWGMWSGFGSLVGDDLLSKLPVLLQGIGAAMISTLVGLGLWAATLSLAAWVPTWTWARVRPEGKTYRVSLDERDLGTGDSGLERLVAAIRGRQPEALCLAFDRRVPSETKAMIESAVWAQRDAELAYREVTLQ